MTESIIFTVLQDVIWLVLLIGGGYLFGKAFFKIYKGEPVFGKRAVGKIEGGIYKVMGVDPNEEMSAKKYGLGILFFSVFSLIFFIVIVMLQALLALNPEKIDGMSWHLAFNTAVSFVTNTNWQAYSGETGLSYLSQMICLTVQNFLSGAVGIAVLFALIRGFTRKESKTVGNVWADITRIMLFMLPVCFMGALLLVMDGVPQTISGSVSYIAVDGTAQKLYLGHAASQIIIKQLFTNGGGFFGVNSAYPYENPTPFTNLIESLSLLWIPAGLCFTFGKAVKRTDENGLLIKEKNQGVALLKAMSILFVVCLVVCTAFEYLGGVAVNGVSSLGNMEGKEVRFGIGGLSLWAVATTSASNGSVNAMHDSFTSIGGMIPTFLMMLGEIVYGGVGCGLYGMIAFALLTVFIAGLMVGRTPEYLGKKIGSKEMKAVCLIILTPVLCLLLGTASTVLLSAAPEWLTNGGAHGFAGEQIPMDGEVIVGVASVDESAITGESAPVIRESGGDRSAVTGGTTVTSDWLIIRVTAEAGKSFLDKMIAMVEGASRKKTPNEIAFQILLITLTIVFLVVSATILPFSKFAVNQTGQGQAISLTNIVALLVCLAPTTIGALLSSIGIAGMARLNKANVLATSGRAIEAAGDVNVLLLDKTGTITLGNRQASEFIPVGDTTERDLAEAAQLSSIADETAEGRSVVVLAKNKFGLRGKEIAKMKAKFIEFSAKTRMSGVDVDGEEIRKGSADAIEAYVKAQGGEYPQECAEIVKRVANAGGTPLVVARNKKVLGVIYLKDVVKDGVKEKFEDLRKIGIKTVMITGDNPMTAAAIAAEAGVDDFVAEATPETKLALIKKLQKEGHLVAMTGDGTNDAPALAQADVAVAMNSGTQAAKEAGNMVDLDSSPTKLIEVVRIGKQLLMTRGALTTFSIANDIAKYFAIIPVLFASIYPGLSALNFMGLTSPTTAILSSIIYNALIIVALIPLSLKGVKYKENPAGKTLKSNLLIYGLGGIIAPFIFIKLFDLLLTLCGVL